MSPAAIGMGLQALLIFFIKGNVSRVPCGCLFTVNTTAVEHGMGQQNFTENQLLPLRAWERERRTGRKGRCFGFQQQPSLNTAWQLTFLSAQRGSPSSMPRALQPPVKEVLSSPGLLSGYLPYVFKILSSNREAEGGSWSTAGWWKTSKWSWTHCGRGQLRLSRCQNF